MTSIPLRRTDAETPWQRATNWLAVLILLGLGFVAGPSDLAGLRPSAAAIAGRASADADILDIPAAADPPPDISDVRAVSL